MIEKKRSKCIYCGRWIEGLTTESCADCNAEILEFQRENYSERTVSWAPRFYVVEEPDLVGGYPVGAGFDLLNYERTLARGHFTPGAVIEDRKRGVRLRVQRKPEGPGQMAVEI